MIEDEELHNINYALDNFEHLLSDDEKTALRAFVATVVDFDQEESLVIHLPDDSEPNEKVNKLLENGHGPLRHSIGLRLLSQYKDIIYANSCRQCGKLPRTPKAKQCPWCRHSWRD